MICGQLHNTRCSWIRKTGSIPGVAEPPRVDRNTVTKSELLIHLDQSSDHIEEIIQYALKHSGEIRGFL
jgi:hypothetical protein